MTRHPATRPMTIGTLSRRSGCSIDTIRYYERIGLLPAVGRSAGGHRLYGSEHDRRLRFIRRSRELGLSLDQVRQMLGRIGRDSCGCDDMRVLLVERAGEVRRKLAELRQLDRSLVKLIAACGDARLPNCRVVESMFAGGEAPARCC